MQLSDRAQRALFGELAFLEKPAAMSAVTVDRAVHVKCFDSANRIASVVLAGMKDGLPVNGRK